MFEAALLDSSAQPQSAHRRAAVPLACLGQAVLVGTLVLVSMLRTQALPTPRTIISDLFLPQRGLPDAHSTGSRTRVLQHVAANPFLAPPVIPHLVAAIHDASPPPVGQLVEGPFDPRGFAGSPSSEVRIPGGVDWDNSGPPPAAPPVRVNPRPRIVKMGGEVTAARALYQPPPVYPRLAQMARIQGMVALQAILARDGTVQDLKVLSGHPLLVQAALDAVKTWRYQPTLLNSEPVEVLTEIDVNFKLEE